MDRNEHFFEVIDSERNMCVPFDATGAQSWGPVDESKTWYSEGELRHELTLYRHPSGHWTLLTESYHVLFDRLISPPEARPLSDEVAVDWLLRHGYEPPADVAHLAETVFYQPRPPQSMRHSRIKPRWDKERRELLLDGAVCKKFRQPAPNQTRILVTFEECGWPSRIDDPIPQDSNVDRRDRLADTVRGLNKGCKGIRFELDGTTEGIIWNADKNADESSPSAEIPF
jgi:hypothetical protein